MVRMSSLPIAEKCGKAAELSASHGAGRPAAMSKAFHAKCAGDPQAFRLISALSHAERDEIAEWKRPSDVIVNDCVLDYDSATKELEVGLDCWGDFTADPAEVMTLGHLDFAWMRWVPVDPGSILVAYVGDIKKSVWTTSDGPESLQLHAYGRAFAKKVGAAAYCVGIWGAKEGKWQWSPEVVHLDGPGAATLFERIAYATQPKEVSTGRHCDACFGRMQCSEYLLPGAVLPELAKTVGLAEPDTIATLALTAAEALRLLEWSDRAEGLAKAVKENLKQAVRRGHLTVADNGKEWRPIDMPGRESIDKDALRARDVDPETVMKRGEPFAQMRWLKAR